MHEIHDVLQPDGSPYPVWNPKLNPRDGAHLMPIITPVFPEMNSSYNVGEPQLRILRSEFARGVEVSFAVEQGKSSWTQLFWPHDFFWRYEHYIQIDVSGRTPDDHRRWFGWCESRLRQLVLCLEQPPEVQAHPHADFHSWDSWDAGAGGPGAALEGVGLVTTFFVAVTFAPGMRRADLTPSIQDWVFKVNRWEQRNLGMDLSIRHVRGQDLPDFCLGREGEQEEEQEEVEPANGLETLQEQNGAVPHQPAATAPSERTVPAKDLNTSADIQFGALDEQDSEEAISSVQASADMASEDHEEVPEAGPGAAEDALQDRSAAVAQSETSVKRFDPPRPKGGEDPSTGAGKRGSQRAKPFSKKSYRDVVGDIAPTFASPPKRSRRSPPKAEPSK